jgi:GntR family transcriptional regulator, transcriptional repressor for pyruvate dehydrogenase complex
MPAENLRSTNINFLCNISYLSDICHVKKNHLMDIYKLNPISSITMTDQVEDELFRYFKDKGFKVGDVLPKEAELVEALGVSRSVVREALSRFRMLGVIDVRKRRGMILTEPDVFSGMQRLLEPHFVGQETMKQLFEVRLMLEMGLGEFLFQRITKKDIANLEDIVAKEKETTNKNDLIQIDILFHSALYKITGNQTLIKLQKMLLPLLLYINDYNSHLKVNIPTGSVSHKDLIGILKTGDADAFRDGIKKHFEPHFTVINKLKTW